MEYRSTNADGNFVHFGGALVAGANSGSGIELNPNSSGSNPIITSAGDETNKGLTVRGKGTGTLVLGSSVGSQTINAQTVTVNSTSLVLGAGVGSSITLNSSANVIGAASTTPIAFIQRYRVDYTVPAMSSFSGAETTVTVTGLTTNSVLFLQNRLKLNSTITGLHARARCSTADELVVELYNVTGSSLSGSTVSAYLIQFSF